MLLLLSENGLDIIHPRILNKDFTTTIENRFAGPLTNVKPGNNDGVFGEEFLNLMST